jgi:hypothetical protein
MNTDKTIIKSRKNFKKLLILTGIYAIFAFILTFSVIFKINNSVVMHADNVSITNSSYAHGDIVTSGEK